MAYSIADRWPLYWRLMRFDRPIGIWLLLWPTLWALWLAAGGFPPWPMLLVFVLGTALMRAAGCVINDYADRDFDPHVERTRNRPIASGRVGTREALALCVVLGLIALTLAMSLQNVQVLVLAVPGAILAAIYPFTKRWIQIPQAVLGVAFSWGIPMAYAAVRGSVPWLEAGALMLANFCWVIAYDTFYAMSDKADDLKVGVKSSAILFGDLDRVITGGLQVTALALLAWIGRDLGPIFYLGLAVAAGFAVRHQWMIRDRDPQQCFAAFLDNNRFGLAVFAGIALALRFG